MRNQGAKIQTSDGKTYSFLSLPILMPEIGSQFLCLVTGSCFHGNCCSPTLSPLPHPPGQRLPFLLPNSPSPLPPPLAAAQKSQVWQVLGRRIRQEAGSLPTLLAEPVSPMLDGGREAWESGRKKEQVSLQSRSNSVYREGQGVKRRAATG